MHVIPDIPALTEPLRLAASALMYARVGRVDRRRDIANDGLLMYTRALQGLRYTLKRKEGILRIETLAAIQILALYEVRWPLLTRRL